MARHTPGKPSRLGLWAGGAEEFTDPRHRFALNYRSFNVCGLYRLYACDGTLLYVGVTTDPIRRWKQHAATKEWWPEVDHILIVPFGSTETARHIERQTIRDARPTYNVQHSVRGVRL